MNILWFSNSSPGYYGYSILTKHVCSGIKKAGHNVTILGMQTLGRGMKDELDNLNIPIRYDPFGGDCLSHYLNAYDIDLFVSALDVWLDQTAYIPQITKALNIPWICHVTINSEPLSPFLAARITESNRIIAPSKWNFKLLNDAGLGNKSTHIPHGVDPKRFYPTKKKEKQKLKEEWGLDVPFIYGILQRNKGMQKNFGCAFHAYKILLENFPEMKENTRMIILTDPFEPEGVKLLDLVNRVGLQDNIKFVKCLPSNNYESLEIANIDDPKAFYHHANFGLNEDEVRKLLGIIDVNVIPSQGESFSLPALEASACKVPNIMANFGTGPEHILEDEPRPRGRVVDLIRDQSGEPALINTPLLSQIANPSPEHMAECMHKMYTDEGFRKLCGKNALEFSKAYAWDNILPRWIELLEEVNNPKSANYATGDLGI